MIAVATPHTSSKSLRGTRSTARESGGGGGNAWCQNGEGSCVYFEQFEVSLGTIFLLYSLSSASIGNLVNEHHHAHGSACPIPSTTISHARARRPRNAKVATRQEVIRNTNDFTWIETCAHKAGLDSQRHASPLPCFLRVLTTRGLGAR